jgi:hypothetical protein
MAECLDFGIGSLSTNIVELRYRSIPQPDSWTYTPYSRVETCGNGIKKGFGFPAATWTWDTLSQHDVNKLLDFITDDDASETVYISTPTDRGGAGLTFDEFSAVMDRPADGQSKTHISRTQRPAVYSNVSVTFSHLIEV